MIISANRMSTMNGNFVIAANESYGIEDMGRILAENERNDMAIFNAMLKTDMYEMQCRTEGTLLESEIQSLNEASIKELFTSLIEKLKKFWAKIKGYFQKAYSMITAYCVRNGKAFIAANRKALSELSTDAKVPGTNYRAKGKFEGIYKDIQNKVTVESIEADLENMDKSSSRSDITRAAIQKFVPGYGDSDKTVFEYMKDTHFEKLTDATIGDYCGAVKKISVLTSDLENGMASVKTLKESEKALEKSVKKSIQALQKQANNSAKEFKDISMIADSEKEKANFYRLATTAYTSGMSTYIKALVKAVKFRLTQERIVLAKAIGTQAHVESTLLESMILEAAESMEAMDNDDAIEAENNPEMAEIIEIVKDAVDEAIADEESEGSDPSDDEE